MKKTIKDLLKFGIILTGLFLFILVPQTQAQSSENSEDTVVKAKVEDVEVKEETSDNLTAKIKIQLLEGTYAGTSLYTDYDGDVKLRTNDEVYVSQTISENELQKVDYVGFNRTSYLIWLLIATAVILISIVVIKSPKDLIPAILLGGIILTKSFNWAFSQMDHYTSALLIIGIIVILSNFIQKGFGILNVIATVGGIVSIVLTMILQVFFSNAMRIPTTDRSLFDVGVVIASAGIIFYNAQKIVFELQDNLRLSEIPNRNKIIREGLEISLKYSGFAVTSLFWAFIGLSFPTIYLQLEEGTTGVGFFNDPEIAQITSAILSSLIGILIVPITTIILSFFIIDVNNLGRRVPKKKQIEMKV